MRSNKLIPVKGEKFDRLTVLQEVEPIGRNTAVLVKCKCGKKFTVRYYSLRNGNTKSCGCLRDEKTIIRNVQTTGKTKKQYVKKDKNWWQHWQKANDNDIK
jgi:hypothetical protein